MPIRERHPAHPLQRPEEVDRGGPRGAQPLDGLLEIGQEPFPVTCPALAHRQRDTEGGGDADGGSAAHDEGADGIGDLLPGGAGLLDFLDRQAGLIQQHEPRAVPADRGDHARAPSRRARSSSRECRPTQKSLSRLAAPLTSRMDERGRPSASASNSTTAWFARPSAGGAVTRTRSVVPCQPTTSLRRARGWTRTSRSVVSGLAVVFIRGTALEVLIQETLVHLDGGAERLGELPAHALDRGDLSLDGRLLRPRRLDDLLSLQLRLAHHEVRLAPGAFLHLLHDLLRGHQRLLQDPLAVLQAPRALLEGLELFLEENVLLEQGLVVPGQILEEGVHLLHIEATEHSHGELLLANVHGRDAHGGLLFSPRGFSTASGAGSEGPRAPRTGWR